MNLRDDVVFVFVLEQTWIYKVDWSWVNEYGNLYVEENKKEKFNEREGSSGSSSSSIAFLVVVDGVCINDIKKERSRKKKPLNICVAQKDYVSLQFLYLL